MSFPTGTAVAIGGLVGSAVAGLADSPVVTIVLTAAAVVLALRQLHTWVIRPTVHHLRRFGEAVDVMLEQPAINERTNERLASLEGVRDLEDLEAAIRRRQPAS